MLSLKLVRSLVFGETISTTDLLLNQNHHDHHDGTHNYHDDHNNGDDDDDGGNDDDDDNGGSGDNDDDAHKRKKGKRRNRRRRCRSNTTTTSTAPLLLFLPTREVVKDTHRLATIARDMGMDFYPDPSLSHIIFSWPSSSSSSSSSNNTSSSSSPWTPSIPSLWSSSSSSWSSSLTENAVPLPFPSLTTASLTHLRCFTRLSRGLFKLVLCRLNNNEHGKNRKNVSNWDCSSLTLFSRVTGDRIDTMDGFIRALAGLGWTFFKTKNNPSVASGYLGSGRPLSVYLFRKIDSNRRIQARSCSDGSGGSCGEFRIRELRLPNLDFKNAPLRILQYILLITDDIFYLA